MSFGTGTDEGDKPMEVRNKKNGSPKCRGGSTITGTTYASSQQATCAFSHSIQRKFNSSHASTWGLIVRSSRYNFFVVVVVKREFQPICREPYAKIQIQASAQIYFHTARRFCCFQCLRWSVKANGSYSF